MGFSRRHDEFDKGRRLLQGFQERVKSILGHLVNLIDDIDFEPALGWLISHILDDLPDLIDPSIGSPVNLVDIDGTPCRDLEAMRAFIARVRSRPLFAIERFS